MPLDPLYTYHVFLFLLYLLPDRWREHPSRTNVTFCFFVIVRTRQKPSSVFLSYSAIKIPIGYGPRSVNGYNNNKKKESDSVQGRQRSK